MDSVIYPSCVFCWAMFNSLIWDYGYLSLACNGCIYLAFYCYFFLIKSASGLFLFGKLMGSSNWVIAIVYGSNLLDYHGNQSVYGN
jgi:hypothetical protein